LECCRQSVRGYASVLFGETPTETATLGKEFVEQAGGGQIRLGQFRKSGGFRPGTVRAAREAVGDKCDLMIDAGHAWNVENRHRASQNAGAAWDTWLEEPLSQDDRKGYGRLCPHRRSHRGG